MVRIPRRRSGEPADPTPPAADTPPAGSQPPTDVPPPPLPPPDVFDDTDADPFVVLPLAWLGDVHPGHTGPAVLTAQLLLRAHGYQLGALDGIAGRETTRAITRFRADHELPAGDRVTADVWALLAADPG